MSAEAEIQAALDCLGVSDILVFARQHATTSLFDLAKMLNAGIAPYLLEEFMAHQARAGGRYDDFVRTEAVRRLNESFPEGIGQTKKGNYGISPGWAGLIEPSKKQLARETWDSLIQMLRSRPDWCPSSPDDESVLGVFRGRTFALSEGAGKLATARRRMEEIMARDNSPFSDSRATENFRNAPRGYGWLYGLVVVHGEVCNGGFWQYYGNNGGTPTPFAVEGLRAIGRDDLASIVEESLASAFRSARKLIAKDVAVPGFKGRPRSLDDLDDAYLAMDKQEERDWLDLAMERLVTERASEF